MGTVQWVQYKIGGSSPRITAVKIGKHLTKKLGKLK